MNNIIKELTNNKLFNKLLDNFKKDFEKNYRKSNETEKMILDNFRDAIYRKWLFSPFVEGSFATPSYLINNFAQNFKKGNYTILPHINISIDNEKLTFNTEWLVYTETYSPVLEDLYKLREWCNPHIIIREGNKFLVDNGEYIINDLKFRSAYYIEYLIELGERLGIFTEVRAIGCKCYHLDNDKSDKFDKLTDKDKVRIIIEESIELSNIKIKEELQIENSKIAFEMFDNSVDGDLYDKYLDERSNQYENILGDISREDMSKELVDSLKQMESILGASAANTMAFNDVGIALDNHFTIVFGYYLGLINPIYNSMFFIDVFLKVACKAAEVGEVLGALFKLELGHDLTALGNYIANNIKTTLREKSYNEATNEEIISAIDYYLTYKEQLLNDELKALNEFSELKRATDIFSDEEDNEDKFLDGLFQEYISEDIKKHLDEFYTYLLNDKKLKEKTCNKHYGNIEFYINYYLGCEDLSELRNICKESMHLFLIEFFIPKVASSKTSVKEIITSLNQYIKYLSNNKLIDKETVEECREVIKDKELYISYFDEYMNEIFDYYDY